MWPAGARKAPPQHGKYRLAGRQMLAVSDAVIVALITSVGAIMLALVVGGLNLLATMRTNRTLRRANGHTVGEGADHAEATLKELANNVNYLMSKAVDYEIRIDRVGITTHERLERMEQVVAELAMGQMRDRRILERILAASIPED